MLARYLSLSRCNFSRIHGSNIRHSSSNVFKSRHNQAIVDLLLKYKLEEESKAPPNIFKAKAFAKAIYAVLRLDQPIRSGKDVQKVEGIGPGIVSRINEYLLLEDASLAEKEPEIYEDVVNYRLATVLGEIPSIGPATAKKLAKAGCFSLEDLKSGKYTSLLSTKQALNLKYDGHLDHEVERKHAEEVMHFCRESLDSAYDVHLVGDYRRGLTSLSEICIMISHPDYIHVPLPPDPDPQPSSTSKKPLARSRKSEKLNILHSTVILQLKQRGLLAESFSSSHKTWHGIVRLPGPSGAWGDTLDRLLAIEKVDGDFRKISIHLVPQKSLGSSMIVLTGDAHFEKDIGYRARQRGMLFNEYGLWRWTSFSPLEEPLNLDPSTSIPTLADSARQGYWSLLNSATEEDIFRALEMPFVDPAKRNFAFISQRTRSRSTNKRSSLT